MRREKGDELGHKTSLQYRYILQNKSLGKMQKPWHVRCKEKIRMKTQSIKLTAIIALLISMLAFSGCHTVKGAGKDIENAGQGIQNSADKHS